MKNWIKYILFFYLIIFGKLLFSQEYTVVIDVGHGGRDPGNLTETKNLADEKHINLEISLKVGELIEQNLKNVAVIYTRTTDKSVSLDDRVYMANSNNADFFISIHCDSHSNSDIHGCRAHIHNANHGKSSILAKKIVGKMETVAGRKNLGVQDSWQRGGHYFVLKNTSMPAVLVECGFMTNSKEELFLNSEKGKNLIADAIYSGFEDFVNQLNTSSKNEKIVEKEPEIKGKNHYRVQISASTESIPLNKFKSLNMNVKEVYFEDEVFKYKYYVGEGSSLNEAKKIRIKVIEKGYKDAFVVKNE